MQCAFDGVIRLTSAVMIGSGLFIDEESPEPLEEPEDTDDVPRVPGLARLEWTHVHLVESQRIGSPCLDHFIGIDDVSQ